MYLSVNNLPRPPPPPPLPPRIPPQLPPRDTRMGNNSPEIEPIKTLPKDRRCFIPVSQTLEQPFTINLNSYRELANNEGVGDRANNFLKLLYSDPVYKTHVKKKRGAKGINWKLDGDEKKDFKYPVLHEANKIYNAFHKKSSLKNKNRRETKPAEDFNRCHHICANGKRCKKSVCSHGNLCTQHFKKFTLQR